VRHSAGRVLGFACARAHHPQTCCSWAAPCRWVRGEALSRSRARLRLRARPPPPNLLLGAVLARARFAARELARGSLRGQVGVVVCLASRHVGAPDLTETAHGLVVPAAVSLWCRSVTQGDRCTSRGSMCLGLKRTDFAWLVTRNDGQDNQHCVWLPWTSLVATGHSALRPR
jgi:hypothetical protein